MKLSVVYDGKGTFRVHAATCRDVKRDAMKYLNRWWILEAEDTHAANTEMWGDVATDEHKEGSDRWHEACDSFADFGTVYLPCCEELPERFHRTDPRATAHLAGRS